MDLTLIVPYHNEKFNLPVLYNKIIQVFCKINEELKFKDFEIIFIDDGSNDGSTDLLIEEIDRSNVKDIKLKIVIYRFLQNLGQSAALSLGFSKCTGKYVVTIDSDLQNDPFDILPMLKKMIMNDFDVVSGYRQNRNEGLRVKISNIGNVLIRFFSGYNVKDVGCSLKIYKKSVIQNLKLPYGYHRFLPIITKADKDKIYNYPVRHLNRVYGRSHYGYSRIIWLLKNILAIPFIRGNSISRIRKSLIFFNIISVIFFLISIVMKDLYFLFIFLVSSLISLKINNFVVYQRIFDDNQYEEVYRKIAMVSKEASCL